MRIRSISVLLNENVTLFVQGSGILVISLSPTALKSFNLFTYVFSLICNPAHVKPFEKIKISK